MSKPSPYRDRTTNWSDYNAALRRRASLLEWLDKGMAWLAQHEGKPGRVPVFSDAAIQFCLKLRHSQSTGQYGDLRVGSKSVQRADLLSALSWFPRSRFVRSLRPFASSTSQTPFIDAGLLSPFCSSGSAPCRIPISLFLGRRGTDRTGHPVGQSDRDQGFRSRIRASQEPSGINRRPNRFGRDMAPMIRRR